MTLAAPPAPLGHARGTHAAVGVVELQADGPGVTLVPGSVAPDGREGRLRGEHTGRCQCPAGSRSLPGSPSPILTRALSLALCGALVAAGTAAGRSEVPAELVPATVEPEVSALSLGCVGGLCVVETPGLRCGSGVVPGGAVRVGPGWGLVLSCPKSSGELELLATDPAAAWEKHRKKDTGAS